MKNFEGGGKLLPKRSIKPSKYTSDLGDEVFNKLKIVPKEMIKLVIRDICDWMYLQLLENRQIVIPKLGSFQVKYIKKDDGQVKVVSFKPNYFFRKLLAVRKER